MSKISKIIDMATRMRCPLLVVAAATLSACGGGGVTGANVSGLALDGYLRGAVVCLDTDRNGMCGIGEPQATTDTNGAYNFTIPDGYDNARYEFLVDVPPNAVDSDNPNQVVGKSYVMRAPFYERSIITPLTTIVTAHVANGLDLATAKRRVADDLGLPTDFDFAKDYIAESDVSAHNAAKVVARILQTQSVGNAAEILTAVANHRAAIRLAAASSTAYTSTQLDTAIAAIVPEFPTISASPPPNGRTAITIYSDSYEPVAGVNTNPNWGQKTISKDLALVNNRVVQLKSLNYQGIEFPVQDVSDMNALHVDIWSQAGQQVTLKLVSSAAALGASAEKESSVTLTLNSGWNSIDLPLSYFSAPNLERVDQLVWVGEGSPTIVYDNIHFWNDPNQIVGPITAAPTPTFNSSNVTSIFSDVYSSVSGLNLNPVWGQTTVMAEKTDVNGGAFIKLSGLNYQGTQFNEIDVSSRDALHVDIWSEDAGSINLFLISPGPAERSKTLTLAPGWNSFDIPLSYYDDVVNLERVIQLKWDGLTNSSRTIYFDNLFFYNDSTRPFTPAAAPNLAATSVVSIYSDAYDDVVGVNLNPNWGQSTSVSQLDDGVGKFVKLGNLNYQGIDFAATPQNVSSLSNLHVDIWSESSATVNLFLISSGAEKAKSLSLSSGWNSFDIPLSEFGGVVNLNAVIQIKWDAVSAGPVTIYYDNLYFH